MQSRNLPERKVMYRALLERDSNYEGLFYVGVKTTGVFCRPTCRARKPKEKNTEYFSTSKEALDHGYRACKVCKPMQTGEHQPPWVLRLLNKIHSDPATKIRDFDLRKMDIDPVKLRRWFLKNHGMTFHAYQRSVRINYAYDQLQSGNKITDTAYNSGFESLSGFNSAFKKITTTTPGKADHSKLVTLTRIESPLGPLMAGCTAEGICLLEFTDRKMLETQLKSLKRYLGAVFVEGHHNHLGKLRDELHDYFQGTKLKFDSPLDLTGTDFQKEVWKNLIQIKPGNTRSYKQQAELCGRPEAVRAVARANGANKISILIPCHRVIGQDGSLTGYGGGLWRKRWLLSHESRHQKS